MSLNTYMNVAPQILIANAHDRFFSKYVAQHVVQFVGAKPLMIVNLAKGSLAQNRGVLGGWFVAKVAPPPNAFSG